MKKFKFYKELDGRWYVDLPDWKGVKADLEMVGGADSMLEVMAEGNNSIWLYMSDMDFVGADRLDFVRLTPEVGEGAIYNLVSYKGIDMSFDVWLCDVTKFVFGDFPKTIFIALTS